MNKKEKEKNIKWARKRLAHYLRRWEYDSCKFDGKDTVVYYKNLTQNYCICGVSRYFGGDLNLGIEPDKRSDVVAGHLADVRARINIMEEVIEDIKIGLNLFRMFNHCDNKWDELLLQARHSKNNLKKEEKAIKKSLDFNKKI